MILLTGNLVFIPIDSNNEFNRTAVKYITGSTDGQLFTGDIYTEAEIRAKWPDIKTTQSFLTLKDTYNER